MIKKSIFIISISLLSLNSFSQKNNSVLWEISGKDIKKPSYLFGTMHMICDASLKPKVKTALDNTSRLFLEIDMDDPNMQQKMMGNILMKDGQKISEFINETDAKKLDEYLLKNFSLSLKLVDNFKPFFLQSLLYTKSINCPVQSIEGELIRVSKEQNEDVFGLETIESQLEIFDKIPYNQQIADVIKMLKDIESNDYKEMEQMMQLYQEEKLDALMTLINQSDIKTTNQFNDDLLINRNKNWVPLIIKASKEQPTFFGVGAAHLSGKQGVISLLKKQGYKVKPVN